jgi:hypothetical protein
MNTLVNERHISFAVNEENNSNESHHTAIIINDDDGGVDGTGIYQRWNRKLIHSISFSNNE